MLKISEGEINTQATFEIWAKKCTDDTLQRSQNYMISLSKDEWWVHHVSGTVDLHHSLVLKHNLCREWLNLACAVPYETPAETATRTAKAARFNEAYTELARKLYKKSH